MTPYFELHEPKCILHSADVLQAALAPESVDLIITSPPYNVEVVYGAHRDDLSYAEYLEFCEAWLKRCYEWLKPDGRMCLNIPLDKNKRRSAERWRRPHDAGKTTGLPVPLHHRVERGQHLAAHGMGVLGQRVRTLCDAPVS
jgi:DNA modification methylase